MQHHKLSHAAEVC